MAVRLHKTQIIVTLRRGDNAHLPKASRCAPLDPKILTILSNQFSENNRQTDSYRMTTLSATTSLPTYSQVTEEDERKRLEATIEESRASTPPAALSDVEPEPALLTISSVEDVVLRRECVADTIRRMGGGWEYNANARGDQFAWTNKSGSIPVRYSAWEKPSPLPFNQIFQEYPHAAALYGRMADAHEFRNRLRNTFDEDLTIALNLFTALMNDRNYHPHIQEMIAFNHAFGFTTSECVGNIVVWNTYLKTDIAEDDWFESMLMQVVAFSAAGTENHINGLGQVRTPPGRGWCHSRVRIHRERALEAFSIYRLVAALTTGQSPTIYIKTRRERYYTRYKFPGGLYVFVGREMSQTVTGRVFHALLRPLGIAFVGGLRPPTGCTSRPSKRMDYHFMSSFLNDKTKESARTFAREAYAEFWKLLPESFPSLKDATGLNIEAQDLVLPLLRAFSHGLTSPEQWMHHTAIDMMFEIPRWMDGSSTARKAIAPLLAILFAIWRRSGFSIFGPKASEMECHVFKSELFSDFADAEDPTDVPEEYSRWESWKKKAYDLLQSVGTMVTTALTYILTVFGVDDPSAFSDGLLKSFKSISVKALTIATQVTLVSMITRCIMAIGSLIKRLIVKITGVECLTDVPTLVRKVQDWMEEARCCLDFDKTWIFSRLAHDDPNCHARLTDFAGTGSIMGINKLNTTESKSYGVEVGRLNRNGRCLREDVLKVAASNKQMGSEITALLSVINSTLNELRAHENAITPIIQGLVENQEQIPTVLAFSGESGVGKTALQSTLNKS
jgi:hypothetical protein